VQAGWSDERQQPTDCHDDGPKDVERSVHARIIPYSEGRSKHGIILGRHDNPIADDETFTGGIAIRENTPPSVTQDRREAIGMSQNTLGPSERGKSTPRATTVECDNVDASGKRQMRGLISQIKPDNLDVRLALVSRGVILFDTISTSLRVKKNNTYIHTHTHTHTHMRT